MRTTDSKRTGARQEKGQDIAHFDRLTLSVSQQGKGTDAGQGNKTGKWLGRTTKEQADSPPGVVLI